jgi:cytochrome c1
VRGYLVGFVLALAAIASGCDDAEKKAAEVTGGDPRRGREQIRERGCGTCHTIPGVPGATSLVGPPLDKLARRAYLAGTLPNTPSNLRTWITHPQQVKPGNAMPDVGLADDEARNITAFLYTLR